MIRAHLVRTRLNLVTYGWHPGGTGTYRGFGDVMHGFCIIGALRHEQKWNSVYEPEGTTDNPRNFLDACIGKYTDGVFFDAMAWNDEQESIEPVLAFLDYCIERAPN